MSEADEKETPEELERNRLVSEASTNYGLMKNLVELPGWKRLMEIANAQCERRANLILHIPAAGTEAALAKECEVRTRMGIVLFTKLPEAYMRSLQLTIKTGRKQEIDDVT